MKLTVMVVDDELPALDEMAEALGRMERVGQIETFSSSVQALRALPDLKPDIVFLDIQMPGVSGLAFAEAMLEQQIAADIVFVTAYRQFALTAFELAATDYMLKPIKLERLRKTLERIAGRRQAWTASKRSETRLAIECFGHFRVGGDDCEGGVRWSTGKVEEAMAYLAVRGRTTSDRMLDDLFGDTEYEKAKQYLHTCIYQIRKSLKLSGLAEHISVVFDQKCYDMELSGKVSDMARFEALLRKGTPTDEELLEAFELYKGELLPGVSSSWVVEPREYYSRMYEQLLNRLVARCLERGDVGKSLGYAEKRMLHVPLNEKYALHLMQLYVDDGRRQQAKAFYGQFAAEYRKEFGVDLTAGFHDRAAQMMYGGSRP